MVCDNGGNMTAERLDNQFREKKAPWRMESHWISTTGHSTLYTPRRMGFEKVSYIVDLVKGISIQRMSSQVVGPAVQPGSQGGTHFVRMDMALIIGSLLNYSSWCIR